MSRLNIPFSTGSKTRHNRRVLWIAVIWLIFTLFSITLVNIWFNRDSLSGYAPNNTSATIHLFLSKQAWTKFFTDFKNLPLISNRSLTISDLASFKPKEISIFILSDNSSAVAIRVNEQDLPKELLNSYGINLQNLGQNRWLLSSQPLPFSAKSQTTWSLGSIWPGTLGKINTNNFTGYIRSKKTGYVINIPKLETTRNKLPALPDNTIIASVIQPKTNLSISSVTQQIDLLLAPLESIKSTNLIQTIQENGGIILLSQKTDNPKGADFLIETKLDSSSLSQTLQISTAFKNTTTKKMEMPDGSTADEILINPSSVEFTSIWVGGEEVKSAETENGSLFTLDREETDLIASNQQLLEDYLLKKIEKNKPGCGSKNNLIYLRPKLINASIFSDHNFVPSVSLLEIVLRFEEISISHNKIYLCY